MSDAQVVILAAVVWVGALFPTGGSWFGLGLSLVSVTVFWYHRIAVGLIAAALFLASFAAGHAWQRIEPPAVGEFTAAATLRSDPIAVERGVRAVAEIDGRRYDVRAWGAPAGWMRNRLMGEQLDVVVSLGPLDDAPLWLRARGLSGRGTIRSVSGFDVGRPHTRIANSIRRTIESGSQSLSRDERSLFAGLVYGDDREQSPLTADNFQAAGLTHLLAVSGQNVAFVLAIVAPLLRRLAHRQRFVVVLSVLFLFATVTRFEASVMRASVMAAVAAVAALVGTEVSGRRMLSLAIAGLILINPLIVHSVAFQLSVAASAGILLWSRRVALAIPGPRPLAESLAVTASAQLAVAPLLVWQFDGLPVASLPANLAAGPVAGPVMMWGLTLGMVAGLVPAWLASIVHLPTSAALWWIDGVATIAPRLPFGQLGGWHIAALFLAAGIGLRQTSRSRRTIAALVVGAVLLQPGVALISSTPHSFAIDDHSTIWRDDATTVVHLDARTSPEDVLWSLRSSNVGAIDLVVVPQATFAAASLIRWMRTRHHVANVWAPATTLGVGETIPRGETRLIVDGVVLTVRLVDGRLAVAAVPGE